jgi:hypothetical protein
MRNGSITAYATKVAFGLCSGGNAFGAFGLRLDSCVQAVDNSIHFVHIGGMVIFLFSESELQGIGSVRLIGQILQHLGSAARHYGSSCTAMT